MFSIFYDKCDFEKALVRDNHYSNCFFDNFVELLVIWIVDFRLQIIDEFKCENDCEASYNNQLVRLKKRPFVIEVFTTTENEYYKKNLIKTKNKTKNKKVNDKVVNLMMRWKNVKKKVWQIM